MASLLLNKQFLFTTLVAEFIPELKAMGYEVTFGDAYRPAETAKLYSKDGRGILNSLHCQRLAIDLMLFKDGKWLTDPADYLEAGELWETKSRDGAMCCWGGRFKKPDAVHFSITHDGVR